MNTNKISRRDFIKVTGVGAAAFGLTGHIVNASEKSKPAQTTIPRWRGFNILDYFSPRPSGRNQNNTTEEDFRWMSDWGFDFVRLPMAYPRWIDYDPSQGDIKPDDLYKIKESAVEYIDVIVEMAGRYGLHVSLNFHRAPGYCVNAGFNEPFNLWKDKEALDAFCFHWGMWAKRYKDLSPSRISFDLVNEPSMREDMNDQHSKRGPVPGNIYRKVAEAAAKAIREANPNHLIIADGNNIGNDVIPEIIDLKIAQSCRGYKPAYISHYKAPWAFKNADNLPEPVWPGKMSNQYWDRVRLEKYYEPWIELARKGVGVHCGECGCWIKTPHNVFLAWFSDVLDILTENGIGYALWNFRGQFGILDSGRSDVKYEDWHGHKLDRKLLELMTKY
jgi:aryl-phospho-beta-D-glucosidase BglC (GH1 family)